MWKALKWLVLYICIQFSIILVFAIYFTSLNNNPNLLGEYLNSNKLYIVIILAIIFVPLLLKQYNKLEIKKKTCDSILPKG